MPRIYRLSRTGLKLIYKIRHHKGHGIHSTFVFNLINRVIEEKTPFYAYQDIQLFLNEHLTGKPTTLNKYNRLSLRLTNHFQAKKILEIGSGKGVNTLCLTAPSSLTVCQCIETDSQKREQATLLYKEWNRTINVQGDFNLPTSEKYDCIVINLDNYSNFSHETIEQLQNYVHDKSFILVKGIRSRKKYQMLWRNMKDMESRTAALDLFKIGILFFDKALYRREYQISF